MCDDDPVGLGAVDHRHGVELSYADLFEVVIEALHPGLLVLLVLCNQLSLKRAGLKI